MGLIISGNGLKCRWLIYCLKRKLINEGFYQLYEIIVQLQLEASDGKKYETDCTDTEGLLRINQKLNMIRINTLYLLKTKN